MKIKNIIDEDFTNYKKPSMFIAFPYCTFKCDRECGKSVCQNSELANAPSFEISYDEIIQRYISNSITTAIVIGGLEPFDSFGELLELIHEFRKICDDDIVIYTGYTEFEISFQIKILEKYKNIIIKFHRYKPEYPPKYDETLGVQLASGNQYARNLSYGKIKIKQEDISEHKKAYNNTIKYFNKKINMLTIKGIDFYNTDRRCFNVICDCDCGNTNVSLPIADIRDGKRIKSCGCLGGRRSGCNYEFNDNYVIGKDLNGNVFYFDKDDYDLLKDVNWHVEKNGYVRGYKDGIMVRMHKLLLNNNLTVDHINHQRNDNRRINLRTVTTQNNTRNTSIRCTNTSGVTGVYYNKLNKYWVAQITVDGKTIHLGSFQDFNEAVKIRKEAEEKYFGEYSYDSSIKIMEEYNIDT